MTAKSKLNCFKAYDIRGRVPDELNPEIALRIGHAYASVVKPKRVVIGHDIRLSSAEIVAALTQGLTTSGVDVLHLGQCGTEEVYFATAHLKIDGGIMVTASHNPKDYNGMKLVRERARPISSDTGLLEIANLVGDPHFHGTATTARGTVGQVSVRHAYIDHLLSFLDRARLKPLKLVVNSGNGCAGPVVDLLEKQLPFTFVKIHHTPDGTFPHGVPNPLLPENRAVTADAVKQEGAALGIAWDGDFDRCFFFDEQGTFIEGYYIVGLLAKQLLRRSIGGKIIYDPRLTWNTLQRVKEAGGVPVLCKSGHAFIKERMRVEDAVYGGEMSAHHYFRDFFYCDSGMIPWLLAAQTICEAGSLSSLVGSWMREYPSSGEINRAVADSEAVLQRVREFYSQQHPVVDETDGLSMEFSSWRFNLRRSNTEPLIRLNVESRGDQRLMEQKTEEILTMIV